MTLNVKGCLSHETGRCNDQQIDDKRMLRRACAERLSIRAVSPEPLLFAHTIYGIRGSFRKRATSLVLFICCARAFTGSKTAPHEGPFSHETDRIFETQHEKKQQQHLTCAHPPSLISLRCKHEETFGP